MRLLGMKMRTRLTIRPSMKGIASIAEKPAPSWVEMKRVTMKLPDIVMRPVYLCVNGDT